LPVLGSLSGRTLATALDDYRHLDGAVPERLNSSVWYSSPTPRTRFYDLQPFDPSSPLVVQEPPATIPRTRINRMGITGDVEEMYPVFQACLQVGKLDRAALVLERLGRTEGILPEQMIGFHNQYLRASLQQLRSHPDSKQAEELHKWYELRIRSEGLPQTSETVACMLKASILSEHGPRLDRLITRYMGMVPGEAGLHVLSMAEILSDQDLAIITDICPTYNLVSESPVSTAHAPETTDLADAAIHEYPEVLATPQKGFGLKTLKQTLSLFSEIPQTLDVSTLPVAERREIQARLERDCIDAAVERWKDDNE